MGKKEDSRSARRLAKPVAFFLIVFLLFFFAKFEVQFTLTEGLTALPDAARNCVLVSSFNGATLVVDDPASDASEAPAQPVDLRTVNMSSNEILMEPWMTYQEGCTTDYISDISVNVTTSNDLSVATKGVINVTVYDSSTGDLLSSELLPLNLQPHTPFSVSAKFSIPTTEASPVFEIKATFPTAKELAVAEVSTHVTLLEYILMELGLYPSAYGAVPGSA